MRHPFLYLVIALICHHASMAQTTAIRGQLRDAYSNEAIPFANIIIQNTNTGTTSDENGRFELGNLKAGFVQLQISSLGYKTKVTEQIMVSLYRITSVVVEMEPTAKEITEIQVVGATFRSRPESPLSSKNIGLEQIEKSAGANRDISKVVQSLPGVGGTVAYRNDLIVRGGGPSENRFYLDGIEIPNLNHFSTQGASGGPVGILNVDFIREVDYYSSAFPSSRGNALSSVFDIKQIDGNPDKPLFKATVGASELALSANTPLSEKTTALFSVRRSYLQFLFEALDLPFLPTFNDIQFKTKTRLSKKDEITFIGLGALDQFKFNKNVTPTPENQYILDYLPVNEQWNYTIGASYKHYFTKSFITLVASRNHLNNKAYKYKDNIETVNNLSYDYLSNETENKLRFEYSAHPNEYTIATGAGMEYVSYDNRTFAKSFDTNGAFEKNYQSDLNFYKYYLFGNVSRAVFNDHLTLSAGLRLDANSYSSDMGRLDQQISPRLAASLKVTSKLYFNTNVGRYFQLPAYTTLGFRLPDGELKNKANRIKPIQADHLIAGLEYRPNSYTRITVEGFYKKYKHYPFSVTDSVSLASKGGDYGVFGDEEVTPTSKGKTYGLELYATQRLRGGYNFILSYTFVRSEFTDYKNDYVPSAWDSKHLLTLTASKSLRNNWDIGIRWRFVGGLPFTPYDLERSQIKEAWDARGREYLDYSQFNARRLENYHQLDLRVDKTYSFKKWQLGAYFDIQNAYGKEIANAPRLIRELDGSGLPIVVETPGQPAKYALTELATQSGTVLPTIGLIVTF